MHVCETWHEVLTPADRGGRSEIADATIGDYDRPVLEHALPIHGNDGNVNKRSDVRA